jgi:pimeloyl-ACP methyl ester carboxylesterase
MKKVVIVIICILILFVFYVCHPTWTKKIDNGISEIKNVDINGTKLEVMIRGNNKNSPVILYVHGGPSLPDYSFMRKYQDLLEKDFIVVNYAERGAGNSYHFFEDYSDMHIETHVNDLLELTKYIKDYLDVDKIILVGHSWGSYIGMLAVNRESDNYLAFVGIGQVVDPIKSEQYTYDMIMEMLEEKNDIANIQYLESIKDQIDSGERFVPRSILHKYGYQERNVDIGKELTRSYLFSRESNLLDGIRYYYGSKYMNILWDEVIKEPLDKKVDKVDIPLYMVMGKYDGTTNPKLAKEYFDSLECDNKEYVLFEESSHFPHFEEEEKFYEFMVNTFIN